MDYQCVPVRNKGPQFTPMKTSVKAEKNRTSIEEKHRKNSWKQIGQKRKFRTPF
jgi:hypothetical protein